MLFIFSSINIVFNNAGAGASRDPIDEISGDDWDFAMALLLKSVAMGIRHGAPYLKQGGGGAIVNTSSMAGVVPLPGLAAYSTAKYAVRGFSESLRMQMAPKGIGVSCLFPGATRTSLVPLPEDDPRQLGRICAHRIEGPGVR